MRRLPVAARLLALGSLLFCARASGDGAPPARPHDIRGVITAVTGGQDGAPLVIRVEERPADSAGSAKAAVRLREATRVLHEGGGAADRATLRRGAVVRVWFAGPVMESYPVQAGADAIVVEREAP